MKVPTRLHLLLDAADAQALQAALGGVAGYFWWLLSHDDVVSALRDLLDDEGRFDLRAAMTALDGDYESTTELELEQTEQEAAQRLDRIRGHILSWLNAREHLHRSHP